MTNQDGFCPPSLEVQNFLFKQAYVGQICEGFPNLPVGSNLIAADGKRGLLYVGHENKLIVFKPGGESSPEWKFQVDVPDKVYRIALSCDFTFLAITCVKPIALIYSLGSVQKHKLDLLHEIRLTSSDGNIFVLDIKWNPAIPDMLCSITSDHTIGCFQVKNTGIQIIGMEKAQGLEAMCVSWSPKGKQIVIGCKNGDIIQLKPELKLARHLSGPNPSEGIIISILWVSNYQFCACYFKYDDPKISVMIVDAPKGVTIPKFTNYEDITFGSGSTDDLCYFLEHIPEWGIILAASSNSSEVAVLGSYDNGTTWNLWQLMDDSTAQLPLNRKTKTENYPVGMAVDKSSTIKLPWGTDATLPDPVPILRILVTSGQLCCYHLVNLSENAPALCSPPSEIIAAPQLRKPNIPPADVSFNLKAGATSTPRSKQSIPENIPVPSEKSKASINLHENSSNSSFSFLSSTNKNPSDINPQAEIKTGGFFNQGLGEEKTKIFQQENKINYKPVAEVQYNKSPSLNQVDSINQLNSPSGFSFKPENEYQQKTVAAPQAQVEMQKEKELAVQASVNPEEGKPKIKEASVYDDGLCLQAYQEEKIKFDKELKIQLQPLAWNCGTQEEHVIIVKKTEEIDEFLRELRETTDSLASDITYLKALLLQSFAWVEEGKSKSSTHSLGFGRSQYQSNKLQDLEKRYYYTMNQLKEANKQLDMQWSEHSKKQDSKMKIPSLEAIYQTLFRYNQIVAQEKKKIDELTKKWRSCTKGSGNGASLERSMANMSISSSFLANEVVIDKRCQLIATNTKNFSKDKQIKLRDLLSESAPRIIRAVRPTAIQDRLEQTLSSLASLKIPVKSEKAKPNIIEQKKVESPRSSVAMVQPKSQNPLSSLDNLISNIPNSNSFPSINQSPSSVAPFSTFSSKAAPTVSAETVQPKSKENVTLSFGQQPSAAYSANKPVITKVESLNFNICSPSPRVSESQPAVKKETPMANFSFGKSTSEVSSTTTPSKSAGFSFSSTASIPKIDSSSVFKFSSKSNTPQVPATAQPALDLSNLSFGSKTPSAATPAFSFGKTTSPPQQNSKPSTPHASPTTTISVDLFGKSNSASKPALSSTSLQTSSNLSPQTTVAASMFGTSLSFANISSGATTSPAFNPAEASTKAAVPVATTPATTMSSASTFGGFPTSGASTISGFSGLLSGTSALSFGSGTSPRSTITPAFGKSSDTVNIFGNNTPTSSSSTTSIFGSKPDGKSDAPASSAKTAALPTSTPDGTHNTKVTTTVTSVFGTATPTTSTSSTFEGQTQKPVTSSSETNLFAPKTPASTESNSTSSLFGGIPASASSGSLFGNSSTSVFGASTQSNSVFGASGSSIFGSPRSIFGSSTTATTTSTSTVFGGTAASSSSTPTFASTAASNANTLTFGSTASSSAVTPAFGSTTTTKGETTSAFETKDKSTPSLGFGAVATSTAGSLFGSKIEPSTTTTTSIFGGSATTVSAPVFGATTVTSTSSSLFGAPATTTTSTSIFGAPTKSVSSPQFGASTTTSASTPTFGSGKTTEAPSIFSAAASKTTNSIFGSAPTTNAPIFGSTSAPATSTSFFGKPATGLTGTSVFGSAVSSNENTSAFGSSSVVNTGTSLFGKPPATTTTEPLFGASVPAVSSSSMFGNSSMFGSSSTAPTTVFGSAVTTASSLFGVPSAVTTTSASIFGSSSATSDGSLFGSVAPQQTANVFGSGGSVFGSPAAVGAGTGNSVFGATASPSSGFGQAPAFGSTSPPAFGGFGSPAAFGSTSPSFGGTSAIGSTSPNAMGNTSPGKFNSTFEALGVQAGGLSFGSLAQKTPEPKPQSFQGSSSFSSWR